MRIEFLNYDWQCWQHFEIVMLIYDIHLVARWWNRNRKSLKILKPDVTDDVELPP